MSTNQPVTLPQTNPKANYLAHQAEIDDAIEQVLNSGWYIMGEQVAAFEQEFATYLGAPHAVGVASGTDALYLALRACNIGTGDTVITVSHTAVATVAAIELTGATPLLVDIDPATFTMEPNHLEDAIRRARSRRSHSLGRLRAVIPVHLYGHPADMKAILELARRYELHVVEDCAQSHGASIHGRMTGTWGDLAAFGFYPTKNLGAMGDGGMVLTGNPELAEQMRMLRQYGWRERYVSELAGSNSRLDELQAAILRVKLRYLGKENEARRTIAQTYAHLLAGTGLKLPVCKAQSKHVYHQYVVQAAQREALRAHLRGEGIHTLIHYPLAIHQQPAYAGRVATNGHLVHTEQIVARVLSLPIYPEMTADQVRQVATAICEFTESSSGR